MSIFEPGTVVRVLQEEWTPFENIRRTAPIFTAATGVRVEVSLQGIPALWESTERGFAEADPPFDLIGADESQLLKHARLGQVEPLDERIAADRYDLGDFEPAALANVSQGGRLYGLPYADISNVLIYRRDLFERFGVAVPPTMSDLTEAALTIQEAVRSYGSSEFYGITLRGQPNCGQIFWHMGSTWAPSWRATWYDADGRPTLDTPEHLAALEHFVHLLERAGPPESPRMGFVECMACYRAGKAAMVIEPANEAAITYDLGGAVAEGTMTTVIPAGPLGNRHAGLYCPPYAIPARSQVKEAAWELAKFLCAPDQVLDDALRSGFVEVARRSVLDDPRFVARFRPDLVATTRATRLIARGDRPMPRQGLLVGDTIAEEYTRALAGEQSPLQALRRAQERVSALGAPN